MKMIENNTIKSAETVSDKLFAKEVSCPFKSVNPQTHIWKCSACSATSLAGRIQKAKTELEKFTMDNPDYCDAWQILANTYLRLKMKKEAMNADDEYKKCSGN